MKGQRGQWAAVGLGEDGLEGLGAVRADFMSLFCNFSARVKAEANVAIAVLRIPIVWSI